MKHVKYPKILQFRNVISNLVNAAQYMGPDCTGEPIYDRSIVLPKLQMHGTVKLHGTNAGISYNHKDGLWIQSRTNIINSNKDNAGFAFFVESNKDEIKDLLSSYLDADSDNTVTVYGEWVGQRIQKGVAISNLEKSLFVFGIKVSNEDESINSYWIDSADFKIPTIRIYNIEDYLTFDLELDLNNPQLIQNELADITNKIEEECPVAKEFGFSGIGEGVVWTINFKNNVYRFKVKGTKHSVSKVKTLASVDVEKLNSINEFVDYSVTKNRVDQGLRVVFGETDLDVKKMGEFIKWIKNDIISEEMDTLVENKLEPKDVAKSISTKAREMFFDVYNKF